MYVLYCVLYLRVTAQVRIPSPRPGGFFVILPLDIVSEDDLSDGGTRDKTGKYRCVVQLGRQRQGAERGAGCHYNIEAPKKTLHLPMVYGSNQQKGQDNVAADKLSGLVRLISSISRIGFKVTHIKEHLDTSTHLPRCFDRLPVLGGATAHFRTSGELSIKTALSPSAVLSSAFYRVPTLPAVCHKHDKTRRDEARRGDRQHKIFSKTARQQDSKTATDGRNATKRNKRHHRSKHHRNERPRRISQAVINGAETTTCTQCHTVSYSKLAYYWLANVPTSERQVWGQVPLHTRCGTYTARQQNDAVALTGFADVTHNSSLLCAME